LFVPFSVFKPFHPDFTNFKIFQKGDFLYATQFYKEILRKPKNIKPEIS